MSKIRKNIGFDALLVFEQHQIYIFSPSFISSLFVAVFAPLTSIITTFFDCKAMTPYNHAVLIVSSFPCWEEVKFVIFTVDHQVAPLTL